MSKFYNAATAMVTIYAPNGDPHTCNRLNANELVRDAGFTWGAKPTIVDEVVEDAVEDDVVEEDITEDEDTTTEEEVSEEFSDETASLEDLAKRVTGDDDVAAYLAKIEPAALHTMAQERFNTKLHHRLSKESLIEKIVELEAARIDAQ